MKQTKQIKAFLHHTPNTQTSLFHTAHKEQTVTSHRRRPTLLGMSSSTLKNLKHPHIHTQLPRDFLMLDFLLNY